MLFCTTVQYHTQIIFPHLHICSGFVCDLHDKLTAFAIWLAHQVIQYIQVYCCAQVIDVGDKNIFLPFSDELLQQTRVIKAGVNVTMTRWIPHICILSCHTHVLSNRQQRFLIYPWIPGKFRERKSEILIFLIQICNDSNFVLSMLLLLTKTIFYLYIFYIYKTSLKSLKT